MVPPDTPDVFSEDFRKLSEVLCHICAQCECFPQPDDTRQQNNVLSRSLLMLISRSDDVHILDESSQRFSHDSEHFLFPVWLLRLSRAVNLGLCETVYVLASSSSIRLVKMG